MLWHLLNRNLKLDESKLEKKGLYEIQKFIDNVINKIIEFSLKQGFDVKNLSFSPITGGDGNIEFLLHLRWAGEQETGESIYLTVSPANCKRLPI